MRGFPIRVDSSRPIFMESDATSFGTIFAHAASDEQAEILKAMCVAMQPHPMQWDYIAIELQKLEYDDVRRRFAELVADQIET